MPVTRKGIKKRLHKPSSKNSKKKGHPLRLYAWMAFRTSALGSEPKDHCAKVKGDTRSNNSTALLS
jgi:hypothetical protein